MVEINGKLNITARAGDNVKLTGSVSDPDGDTIVLRWWQYMEADSYTGEVQVSNATTRVATVQVPRDANAGDTIHLILEATDNGTPALTSYQRVIISVH